MEVNKAASWEDVLANNFSAETQEQKEEVTETQEAVATEEQSVEDTQSSEEVQDQQQETVETETQTETQPETQVEAQEEQVQQQLEEIAVGLDLTEEDEQALFEYLTIKNTDYSEVSDLDIITGYLEAEHQNWDGEDIQFELEQKYGSALFQDKVDLNEIDQELYPEEYKEAVKLNKEIDRAQKLLKRDAMEKRVELEEIKANIQLPISGKIKPESNVKQEVEKTSEPEGLTQEEIERYQKEWIAAVEKEVPTLDEFNFKLGDEDVSYKVTEDEKKQMVETMKNFNAESYLVQRGWINQDGSPNIKKITEDVYILENNEKMFKSGWTQAKEKAKMDLIGKDLKNIEIGSPGKTFDAKGGDPYDFGNYVLSL